MSRRIDLKKKRDAAILVRFRAIKKQNPKWKTESLIEVVATEFFLTPSTIVNILKDSEKVPSPTTIIKRFAI